MSEPAFSEEFPRVSRLFRGLGRYAFGAAMALITAVGLAKLGAPPFLAGWLACTVWLLASGQWEPGK